MDNGKINNIPIGDTAINEDKMNLVPVTPDTEIAKEQLICDINQDMKDTAKDILQTQDMTKKMALMIDLKNRYNNLNMLDFVHDHIGTNNVEGCNYEKMAMEVEDHFFKKIGSWAKKTVDKAADKVRSTTSKAGASVTGFFSKGGFIDKVSRSVDKATGGIYHKMTKARKDLAKQIPVVGKLVGTIDKALKGAKDKGKIDVTEIKQDIINEGGSEDIPVDDMASLIAGMVGTTMASDNTPTPIYNEDRSVNTIQKKETSAGGMDKNTMLMIGGGLAAIMLLTRK